MNIHLVSQVEMPQHIRTYLATLSPMHLHLDIVPRDMQHDPMGEHWFMMCQECNKRARLSDPFFSTDPITIAQEHYSRVALRRYNFHRSTYEYPADRGNWLALWYGICDKCRHRYWTVSSNWPFLNNRGGSEVTPAHFEPVTRLAFQGITPETNDEILVACDYHDELGNHDLAEAGRRIAAARNDILNHNLNWPDYYNARIAK